MSETKFLKEYHELTGLAQIVEGLIKRTGGELLVEDSETGEWHPVIDNQGRGDIWFVVTKEGVKYLRMNGKWNRVNQ